MNKDEYKQLYEQVCEQYDVLAKELAAIKQARALDKMAENARELGLDYEPHKGLSEHMAQATNGRVRIDPVTGNVGIGTAPAQPAPVQEPVAWMDIDEKGSMSGLRYWTEPDNRHEVALYTTPPVQPALVEPDWKAEYLKSVESGCITLDELREARAELDATNRQVEILSDALAESRREVAAIKQALAAQQEHEPENEPHVSLASVQKPVAWRLWDDEPGQDSRWQYYDKSDFKDGVNPMDVFTQLVALYTTPPAAQPAPVQPVAWTDEQLQMLNFLYGAGEWDGLWFDQKHPAKKGAFWWRSDLRRLFTTPPAAAPVQPMAHIVGEIDHTGKVWKPVQPAPVQPVQPVKFLANGTRFKTSEFPYGVCINGLPKELSGRWVALVAAEDDCHLQLTAPPAAQPAVQEPFAYLEIDDIESQREYPNNCRNVNLWHEGGEGMVAIYTTPPAQPAPVQPVAWTDEQLQMLNFLYGAGEWDGLWFDQKHPAKKGAFWWRSDLRRLFTTPPAAQTAPVRPVQPVAWRWTNGKGWLTYGEMQHDRFESTPLYTTPPAQPAVPDALTSADIQEHIEYVAGWNDCRQAMLEMMK